MVEVLPVFPLSRVLLRLVEQIIMFVGVFAKDRVHRCSVDLNVAMMAVFSPEQSSSAFQGAEHDDAGFLHEDRSSP